MQELIEYKGLFVAAAFAALFAFEHFWPAVTPPSKGPFRRIGKNLSFWPINIGLSLAIIFPVSYFASTHALWERTPSLEGFTGLALDIIVLDLFLFWWHRALHEIPFLWRFHEVHHLDEHLDTTSAIRFHFGEIFLAVFVRAVIIVVFAVPFTSIVIFESVVLVLTFFHHSNIALPKWFERPLSKLVITPSIHWVHHHAIRKDTDSNFGTIFSFWDRIFNTKSATTRSVAMKIGVEGMRDAPFPVLLKKPFTAKTPVSGGS